MFSMFSIFRSDPVMVGDKSLWTKRRKGKYGFLAEGLIGGKNLYYFNSKKCANHYRNNWAKGENNKITLMLHGKEVESWD